MIQRHNIGSQKSFHDDVAEFTKYFLGECGTSMKNTMYGSQDYYKDAKNKDGFWSDADAVFVLIERMISLPLIQNLK